MLAACPAALIIWIPADKEPCCGNANVHACLTYYNIIIIIRDTHSISPGMAVCHVSVTAKDPQICSAIIIAIIIIIIYYNYTKNQTQIQNSKLITHWAEGLCWKFLRSIVRIT